MLMSFIEYIGDSNFKLYARSSNFFNLIVGVIAYAFMLVFLVLALKRANLIYVNGLWDGLSAIIETALAFFLLKETLKTRSQYVGLALIIIGIFALKNGPVPY